MEDTDPMKQDRHPFGIIDPAVIASLRELGGEDDPGLLTELIDMFLDDAPARMAEMRRALDEGDIDGIARAAHALKSSSANMGAMLFSKLCKEVEEMARTQQHAHLAEKAERCFAAYSDAERALKEIRTA